MYGKVSKFHSGPDSSSGSRNTKKERDITVGSIKFKSQKKRDSGENCKTNQVVKRFRNCANIVLQKNKDMCPIVRQFINEMILNLSFEKILIKYLLAVTVIIGNQTVDTLLKKVLEKRRDGTGFSNIELLPCNKPSSFSMGDPCNIRIFVSILKGIASLVYDKSTMRLKEHFAVITGFYANDDLLRRNNLETILSSDTIKHFSTDGVLRLTVMRTVYPYNTIARISFEYDFSVTLDQEQCEFSVLYSEEDLNEEKRVVVSKYKIAQQTPLCLILTHPVFKKTLLKAINDLRCGNGLPFLM